jgi:hypothetical protein
MNKLLNEALIVTLVVIPFCVIYGKGLDYYRETVVEPKVGMKCGDGTPNETWIDTKHILIPTYNCATFKHYGEYNRWFISKAKDFVLESKPAIDETKEYFKETSKGIAELLVDIMEILK